MAPFLAVDLDQASERTCLIGFAPSLLSISSQFFDKGIPGYHGLHG